MADNKIYKEIYKPIYDEIYKMPKADSTPTVDPVVAAAQAKIDAEVATPVTKVSISTHIPDANINVADGYSITDVPNGLTATFKSAVKSTSGIDVTLTIAETPSVGATAKEVTIADVINPGLVPPTGTKRSTEVEGKGTLGTKRK